MRWLAILAVAGTLGVLVAACIAVVCDALARELLDEPPPAQNRHRDNQQREGDLP